MSTDRQTIYELLGLTSSTSQKLFDLIRDERIHEDHLTLWGNAISALIKYHEFLTIIYDRYEPNRQALADEAAALKAMDGAKLAARSAGYNEEQIARIKGDQRLRACVYLDIEAFYLFAKIFLDKIARFIEFCFLPERTLALDSHDDLTERFARYALAKDLKAPVDFLATLERLKHDIADFRDQQIAHEKSPRTRKGHSIDAHGEVRLHVFRLFKPAPMMISRPISELLGEVDAYVEAVISLVTTNLDKTRYVLAGKEEETVIEMSNEG